MTEGVTGVAGWEIGVTGRDSEPQSEATGNDAGVLLEDGLFSLSLNSL